MKTVIILSPEEYEDLRNSEIALTNLLNELENLVHEPEKLVEYIKEKLEIE